MIRCIIPILNGVTTALCIYALLALLWNVLAHAECKGIEGQGPHCEYPPPYTLHLQGAEGETWIERFIYSYQDCMERGRVLSVVFRRDYDIRFRYYCVQDRKAT